MKSPWIRMPWFALLAGCMTVGCSDGGNSQPARDAGQDGQRDASTGPQACQTHAGCPVRQLCVGGFCQQGTVCNSEQDLCPEGFSCNLLKEVCLPENPCLGDGDCTDPPRCLTDVGICVECIENIHCDTPTEVCNQDHQCEPANAGPDCSDDKDCTEPDKTRCDPQSKKCVGCASDDHCADGHCDPQSRVCVQCLEHGHCTALTATPQCEPESHVCVACLTNDDCTGDMHCNTLIFVCTDLVCEKDLDCQQSNDGSHCHLSSGNCVACLEHAHCEGMTWCRDFACQAGCQTDAECQAKPGDENRCDPDTNNCYFAECLEHGQCAENPNGAYCDPDASACVQCLTEDHCGENERCTQANECEPQPCYMFADPEALCDQIHPCFYCNQLSGECEPRYECIYDPENPQAQAECCQGFHCNTQNHCSRNLNCDDDEDCPLDSFCREDWKQCVYTPCCNPPCGSGAYCNQDCECENGCHELGADCDPFVQNCCEGLHCSFFPPICKEAT